MRSESTPIFKQCVERAKELLFQGVSNSEIHLDLLHIDSTLHKATLKKIVADAYKQLYRTVHRDREYIFQLHMARYEDLYRKSISMTDRNGRQLDVNIGFDRNIIKGRYETAMKILKMKEDLIGLHNKDLIIEIENTTTNIIKDNIESIHLAQLTLEERVELLALLKEARIVPIEGDRQITVKRKVLNENNEHVTDTQVIQENESVIDIKYEEMPEKVIDKIQEEGQEEKIEYIQSPIVEDCVDRTVERKTLDQVTGNINTNIRDKFEKLMKRKVPKK